MTTDPAGAATGTRFHDKRSSTGCESGWKNGMRSSTASSGPGTTPPSSMRRSRPHEIAPSRGRNAPAATKAPRAPKSATNTGAAIEPRANPAISSPSCTPKIRASTSSRTVRCRSVRPATSKNALPAPLSASITNANGGACAKATSASGIPVTMIPAPSAGLIRRRPTRTAVAVAPTTPPTPTAEARIPIPDSPMSNTSIAVTV